MAYIELKTSFTGTRLDFCFMLALAGDQGLDFRLSG